MTQTGPVLAEAPTRPDGIGAIVHLLACPVCGGPLASEAQSLRCAGCSGRYGLDDGVALLALRGSAGTWGAPQPAETSDAYQVEFQTIERAAAYNHGYQRRAHKRFGTRHEWRLIRRHLDKVGHSRVILELPCGGGRITPAFAEAADFIVEADIAIGQIRYGRATSTVPTPRAWMTASAFHIPLRDASVDGAICIRLAHHLPTPTERERLFHELMRVSQRFVIITFFDHHSIKNLTRRVRHPFNRKPPKLTMTVERVAGIAREAGWRLATAPPLNRIASGHRFALLLKDSAAA
jgi:ubiquinone/menaquinone biosynthesis C-methylase UbiE